MEQRLNKYTSHDFADTAELSLLEFETSDPLLASFLRCRNFDLLHLKLSNDGKMFFVFLDSPELRYGIVEFANDGVVPVRSFYSALRDFEAISRYIEPS